MARCCGHHTTYLRCASLHDHYGGTLQPLKYVPVTSPGPVALTRWDSPRNPVRNPAKGGASTHRAERVRLRAFVIPGDGNDHHGCRHSGRHWRYTAVRPWRGSPATAAGGRRVPWPCRKPNLTLLRPNCGVSQPNDFPSSNSSWYVQPDRARCMCWLDHALSRCNRAGSVYPTFWPRGRWQ